MSVSARITGQFRRMAVNKLLKGLLNSICKIDASEFVAALSKSQPLIIAVNHINFLEVPILVTHSYPLFVTGIVKAETWNNPLFAFIFNTYKAIPIDRTGAFHSAFKRARKAMDNGFFVAIAPEGTRSKNGVLGKGKAGIIELALETNSAILPVVHHGGEQVWKNIRHFKRTPFCFKTGRPFKIKVDGRPDHKVRQEILDEVMGQMARLLPVPMRGSYSTQAEQESQYLEFIES